MEPVSMTGGALAVLASMATPAVLLLANAMLVLSTVHRLEGILDRVRETELMIAGRGEVTETTDLTILNELLVGHAQRARLAHRALLSFYTSAGLFMAVIVALGAAALGLQPALPIALVCAFLGSGLLFVGTVLLIRETWIGTKMTDRRFAAVLVLCQKLAQSRASGRRAG